MGEGRGGFLNGFEAKLSAGRKKKWLWWWCDLKADHCCASFACPLPYCFSVSWWFQFYFRDCAAVKWTTVSLIFRKLAQLSLVTIILGCFVLFCKREDRWKCWWLRIKRSIIMPWRSSVQSNRRSRYQNQRYLSVHGPLHRRYIHHQMHYCNTIAWLEKLSTSLSDRKSSEWTDFNLLFENPKVDKFILFFAVL